MAGGSQRYLEDVVESYRLLWEARGLRPVFEAIADAVAAAVEVDPPELGSRKEADDFDFDGCGITVWIWDASCQEMVLASGRNEPVAYETGDYAMGCNEELDSPLPVTHAVMLAGERRWYEDIWAESGGDESPQLHACEYCEGQGFTSLVAVPLVVPGEQTKPLGIINLFFREPAREEDYESETWLLQALAHHASLAIESEVWRRRARWENALRQQANLCATEDEFLDEAVEIIGDAFDSLGCDIYLPSRTGIELASHKEQPGSPLHYAPGEGLTGATAELRQVLRVNEVGDTDELKRLKRVLDADIPIKWSKSCPFDDHRDRSSVQFMGAPLFLHGDDGPVGVVRVRRKRNTERNWHRYMPMDEELLIALSEIVTESIQHYRSTEVLLRHMAHRHAGDLRMLSEVRVSEETLLHARDLPQYERQDLERAIREVQVWLTGTQRVNEVLDLKLPNFQDLRQKKTRVDLGATLESLARSRFEAFRGRFAPTYDTQRGIMMERRLVTYCAIAWNEVITNVIKHGKRGPSGVLEPTLLVHRRSNGTVEMMAANAADRDEGKKLADAKSGTAIITDLVEQYLDGDVELTYDPQSRRFTCTIVVPAEEEDQ